MLIVRFRMARDVKHIDVRIDDLSGSEVQELIREHLAAMHSQSPPESVHALGVERLRHPSITMFTAWIDSDLAGCGALKVLCDDEGEIKSMRTRESFRRQGVGRAVVQRIIAEARARGYRKLSLETGATADFSPAHQLYESFGFVDCGPFGEYRFDPFSRYMTLSL